MSERRKLPDERQSVTHKFRIGRHKFYLTCGHYPDDGTLGEIFLKGEKTGSTLSGFLDGFSIAFSMALQSGTPLETMVEKFVNTRFEPAGYTRFPEVPYAHSPLDYVARYLALRYLDSEGKPIRVEPAKPSLSVPPPVGVSPDESSLPSVSVPTSEEPLKEAPKERTLGGPSDGPTCVNCGNLLVPTGHCWACPTCGETTGCS